jgi:hypothetical protein
LGSAALLISVHLIGGCILLALGIVGEYVGRIYDQVKARPLYLLKDRSPDTDSWPCLSGLDKKRHRPYQGPSEEGQSAA